jgi:hypothetical protein
MELLKSAWVILRISLKTLYLSHQGTIIRGRKTVQCLNFPHNSALQRVEMNLSNKLLKIWAFLTKDRFAAVLKKAVNIADAAN